MDALHERTAVELRDLFQVPVFGIVSGSLLQVLGAETLLQGRVVESGGELLRYGVLLFIAIPVALVLRRLRWTVLLGMLAALAVGIEAAAAFLQVRGVLHVDTAMWQVCLAGFAIAWQSKH